MRLVVVFVVVLESSGLWRRLKKVRRGKNVVVLLTYFFPKILAGLRVLELHGVVICMRKL